MAVAVMAPPKVVGPKNRRTKASQPIPQSIVEATRGIERVKFDPNVHLNLSQPEKIIRMEDIGLEGAGISPIALTSPFNLFTKDAVEQMRAEVFSPEILENCHISSDFASDMIRAFKPKQAPFIHDAWNSPEVLGFISRLAGIELVPLIEMEIGHCNVSVNRSRAGELQKVPKSNSEDESTFSWHFDSVPFVCVVMLSDCVGMIGGETAIRTGYGEVMKMRGPAQGSGVVMQGRYIEHAALKTHGGSERISMVTSFRPKSPFVKDETLLTGMRPVNYVSDLYNQYTEYRLQVLEERVREQSRKLLRRQREEREFDIPGVREFLIEQRDFIDSMVEQMVDPETTEPQTISLSKEPSTPVDQVTKEDCYDLSKASIGGPTLKGIPAYPSYDLHRQDILQHMTGVFRVFARRGFTEGLAGHISVRDPEFSDTFWTNPFGCHFGQLKAEDMILLNEKGEVVGGNKTFAANSAGFLIHSAVHKRRPDVNAACHMHSTYGRAWSAFGKRLDMLCQDSAAFYGDAHAVYEDFGGIVLKVDESERLAEALGSKGKALILSNHGLLTVGQTVDEAAYLFTLMERLCQIQLVAEAATASGIKKRVISDEIAQHTNRAYTPEVTYCEFQPELSLEMELSNGAFKV